MKIYWFIKSIPEYQNADKTLIKNTWMKSYWKTFRHWQQWLMTAISIASLGFYAFLPTDISWEFEVGGAFLLGIIWLIWGQISIAYARPYLREILENT